MVYFLSFEQCYLNYIIKQLESRTVFNRFITCNGNNVSNMCARQREKLDLSFIVNKKPNLILFHYLFSDNFDLLKTGRV